MVHPRGQERGEGPQAAALHDRQELAGQETPGLAVIRWGWRDGRSTHQP